MAVCSPASLRSANVFWFTTELPFLSSTCNDPNMLWVQILCPCMPQSDEEDSGSNAVLILDGRIHVGQHFMSNDPSLKQAYLVSPS